MIIQGLCRPNPCVSSLNDPVWFLAVKTTVRFLLASEFCLSRRPHKPSQASTRVCVRGQLKHGKVIEQI